MKKSKEQKRQEAKERNLQSFPEKVQSFVDVMPGGIAFMSNVYWHDNMLERLSRLQAAARELDVDLNGKPNFNTGIFWQTERLLDTLTAHDHYEAFLRKSPEVSVNYSALKQDMEKLRKALAEHEIGIPK